MKNMFKSSFAILRSDVSHLSRSIVAVICVIALAIIPCLYAWFNIFSNWDPYIPESTSNFKIAITTEDEGTDLLGTHFNVGDLIINKVQTVDIIDFQFPETTDAMMEGLRAGDYYAALVIPADFSSKLLNFTDSELNKVEVLYYENEKENAVASRITARTKEIAENYINSSFLSTLVDKLSTLSSIFSGLGVGTTDALNFLDKQLENIKLDLTAYMAIMKSMESVTASAAQVSAMTNQLIPDIVNMLVNSRTTISNMQDRLTNGKQDIIYAADAIRNSSQALRNTMEKLDSMTSGDPSGLGGAYIDFPGLANEGGLSEYEGEILDTLYRDVNRQIHDSVIAFDDIIQQSSIDSNFINSIGTLQDSLGNIDGLIDQLNAGVNSASASLGLFNTAVQACAQSIAGASDTMAYLLELVNEIQGSINEFRSSDSFTTLIDLMNNDMDGLVEYLSSPANLEVVRVFAVDNWGSGTAPYYTMLSLYACALLTGTIVKTHVKRKGEFENISDSADYFGRFWLFFLIGQVTALITSLGNIYYVGMQCYNPFYFWLTTAVTSMLFTSINYGLIFAAGSTGEMISIIILVIQVAGAGGTYPMEMMPKFFQSLYSYMPFNYAMTALRETIGGMQGNTYLRCILTLLLMTAIMIPLCILIYKLNRRSLEKMDRAKHATGLLH